MGAQIAAAGTDVYVERRGEGPDVLLIAIPPRRGSPRSRDSPTATG